jgi:hypothetical protein
VSNLFQAQAMSGGPGSLLSVAYEIVDAAKEAALPESQRLRGYSDGQLPQRARQLTSQRPYYKDAEVLKLDLRIDNAMGLLGKEHAYVKALAPGFAADTNNREADAKRLIDGTSLDQLDARKALVEGGLKAIEASKDSLIQLALATHAMRRKVDADNEALRVRKEAAHDDLTKARKAINKPGLYPDATGTLRLTAGVVKGYNRDGVETTWMTTYGGLFDRARALATHPEKADFALPQRWWDARSKLNLDTQLNFVNTADIIGGSSGSPVLNVKGEIVGLQFDGNNEQTGNRFGYEERKSRSVSVSMVAMMEALDKVYGATELLKELK